MAYEAIHVGKVTPSIGAVHPVERAHPVTGKESVRQSWLHHEVMELKTSGSSALQHATFDDHPHVRHGHHVTIRGDKPFLEA